MRKKNKRPRDRDQSVGGVGQRDGESSSTDADKVEAPEVAATGDRSDASGATTDRTASLGADGSSGSVESFATSKTDKSKSSRPASAAGSKSHTPKLDAPSRALAEKLSRLSSQSRPGGAAKTTMHPVAIYPTGAASTASLPSQGVAPTFGPDPTTVQQPPRHDFRTTRLLSENEIRSLDTLHRKFAQSASRTLSAMARLKTSLALTETRQCTYFEFIRSLRGPTSMHLLYFNEERLPLVAEMSRVGLFPLIDRLMGGQGDDSSYPLRPFTRIEQSLVNLVVDRLMSELAESWSPCPGARFELGETEHNPMLMRVFPAHDATVVVAFELRLGNFTGTFQLCIPTIPFHATLARLAESTTLGSKSPHLRDSERRRQLLETLGETALTVTAELGAVPIRLQDLLSLQPGDVIDSQINRASEVAVSLDGKQVVRGLAARTHDRRVIKVTGFEIREGELAQNREARAL